VAEVVVPVTVMRWALRVVEGPTVTIMVARLPALTAAGVKVTLVPTGSPVAESVPS
jgi:hypothetical protein